MRGSPVIVVQRTPFSGIQRRALGMQRTPVNGMHTWHTTHIYTDNANVSYNGQLARLSEHTMPLRHWHATLIRHATNTCHATHTCHAMDACHGTHSEHASSTHVACHSPMTVAQIVIAAAAVAAVASDTMVSTSPSCAGMTGTCRQIHAWLEAAQ